MKRDSLHVVGAAIIRRGTCLVAQRGPEMSFSRKWEFPGGKIEPGEQPAEALRREIREELHLDIEVGEFLASGYSPVGARPVRLDVYAATVAEGTVLLAEHSRHGWFHADDLESLDWVEPDRPIVPAVKALLRRQERQQPAEDRPDQPFVPAYVAAAWRWTAWPVAMAMLVSGSWSSMLLAGLAVQNALLTSVYSPQG